VFERAKTFHALDRAAAVIGDVTIRLIRINLVHLERGLIRPGDNILIVSGYTGLPAPNLQYYLPVAIIATITNRECVEQTTEGVFRASASA
jgi:hypothetical protein